MALTSNLRNPLIKRLHTFITPNDYRTLANSNFRNEPNKAKIKFILKEGQPTYSELFHYATTIESAVCCICNSDISVEGEETVVEDLTKRLKSSSLAYFLTRHEVDRSCPLINNFGGSHDAFIFDSENLRKTLKPEHFDEINYVQNTPGIEAVLTIFFIEKLHYFIQNPCYQIKLIHHHNSNVREWEKLGKKPIGYTSTVSLDYPGVQCRYMIHPQHLNLGRTPLDPIAQQPTTNNL